MLRADVQSAPCVDRWTGWVGALYSVVLILSYSFFLSGHQHGGKLLAPPFSGTVLGMETGRIGQDFYDVLLMIALVLGAMSSWEKLTSIRRRLFFLVLALSSAGNLYACVWGGTWMIGEEKLTSVTCGLMLSMLGFIGLFFLEIFSAQKRGLRIPCDFRTAFSVGLSRFAAGLVVLLPFAAFSLSHPHFGTSQLYRIFRFFLALYVGGYLTLGLPWMILTEWVRHGSDNPKKDVFFPVICLMKQLRFFVLGDYARGFSRLKAAFRKRFIRFGILDLVVKGFFTPIMLHFVFQELSTITAGMNSIVKAGGITWSAGYTVTLHTILIVDVIIAVIGYLATSRWLQNKSVSVDPTAGGWAIALFCYPPFNTSASTLFPFSSGTGTWFPAEALIFQQIAVLLLFMIYVWATIVFGLRFSNLTNRGVIDHGPYRYVRHPAYISKSVGWWAEHSIRFSNPWQAIVLFLFCGVYALRALTEERHLRADPMYRVYEKKVRWRFIPGLI